MRIIESREQRAGHYYEGGKNGSRGVTVLYYHTLVSTAVNG